MFLAGAVVPGEMTLPTLSLGLHPKEPGHPGWGSLKTFHSCEMIIPPEQQRVSDWRQVALIRSDVTAGPFGAPGNGSWEVALSLPVKPGRLHYLCPAPLSL